MTDPTEVEVPGPADAPADPDAPVSLDEGSDGDALEIAEEIERKVLFVAGAGRSGTSTMAGLMKIMGLLVPPPEVPADATNPKGFAEPAWAVEFHDDLLRRAEVQVGDARPAAWFKTGQVGGRERPRADAAAWLEEHLAANPELVVKDPRLAWFITMWEAAAARVQATPVFVTMLRSPAEVVASKETYYANRLGSAHLAASWVNMLLHTERATRSHGESGRVFVRYGDLLDDWTKTVMHVGESLQLQHILHAGTEVIREGHRFVDPGLRRMTRSLDELQLPTRLQTIVAESWEALNTLADPGSDTPELHKTLDELRDAYSDLYEEAEAISQSSAVAAKVGAARARRKQVEAAEAAASPSGGRDAADRIPHGVRAMVPASVRRQYRKRWERKS